MCVLFLLHSILVLLCRVAVQSLVDIELHFEVILKINFIIGTADYF